MDLGCTGHSCILTLMLLCMCVCVLVCVWHVIEGVSDLGLVSWWRLIFFWIWRGAHNVHCLLSSASVLSLHTHPHFSNFQSLALQSVSGLAFYLIHSFIFDDHSCMPEGLPPLHFVKQLLNMSVKFVSASRCLSEQLVCSNEWTTFVTCHSSAMLLYPPW